MYIILELTLEVLVIFIFQVFVKLLLARVIAAMSVYQAYLTYFQIPQRPPPGNARDSDTSDVPRPRFRVTAAPGLQLHSEHQPRYNRHQEK